MIDGTSGLPVIDSLAQQLDGLGYDCLLHSLEDVVLTVYRDGQTYPLVSIQEGKSSWGVVLLSRGEGELDVTRVVRTTTRDGRLLDIVVSLMSQGGAPPTPQVKLSESQRLCDIYGTWDQVPIGTRYSDSDSSVKYRYIWELISYTPEIRKYKIIEGVNGVGDIIRSTETGEIHHIFKLVEDDREVKLSSFPHFEIGDRVHFVAGTSLSALAERVGVSEERALELVHAESLEVIGTHGLSVEVVDISDPTDSYLISNSDLTRIDHHPEPETLLKDLPKGTQVEACISSDYSKWEPILDGTPVVTLEVDYRLSREDYTYFVRLPGYPAFGTFSSRPVYPVGSIGRDVTFRLAPTSVKLAHSDLVERSLRSLLR